MLLIYMYLLWVRYSIVCTSASKTVMDVIDVNDYAKRKSSL